VKEQERLPGTYWRLWWSAAVDNVGDGAFVAAIPLLAVRLTDHPILVSAVTAAAFLPWLLLSLPAGALVDRYDRLRLMSRSLVVQALIVGAATVLVLAGGMRISVLIVMAFLLGACDVVIANAGQALLPEIVPSSSLHRANGYLNSVVTIGESFLGPPLGSLLFTVAVALPFGINTASFALSAALVASRPRRPVARIDHPPLGQAIKDGLHWLFAHRMLRVLALLLGVNAFCFAMGNATLVLLATRTLHVSARGYGLLLAAAAIGSVVGGVVNARVIQRFGALPALLTALAGTVIVFEGIGLAPNAVVLAALLALNGFAATIWNILTVTLRQQIVPDDLRGRVNSAYRMVGWGPIPLGALAGGLVATTLGFRAPYLVAGGVRALGLALALPALVVGLKTVRPDAGT
jgi:MFS family permease